jgi:hypothetical protein
VWPEGLGQLKKSISFGRETVQSKNAHNQLADAQLQAIHAYIPFCDSKVKVQLFNWKQPGSTCVSLILRTILL